MTIHNLAANVQAFTSNVFLIEGERTVVVDPGANFDVLDAIDRHVEDLDAVVLTHSHPDHVGNTRTVTDAYGVESYGFDPDHPMIDRAISDEEVVRMGEYEYVALHTPGHIDDHLCFFAMDPGILIAGDLVFQNGGFGRTDLEGGDRNVLVSSIERVLARVEGNLVEMHTGHGPSVMTDPVSHVQLALQSARV